MYAALGRGTRRRLVIGQVDIVRQPERAHDCVAYALRVDSHCDCFAGRGPEHDRGIELVTGAHDIEQLGGLSQPAGAPRSQ